VKLKIACLISLLAAFALTGCAVRMVRGAGATFPDPLYQDWITDYTHSHPDAHLKYNPVGSEEGVGLVRQSKVDFGGSDWPLTPEEEAALPKQPQNGAAHIYLPVVAGAVSIIYHADGVSRTLRFTPETLCGIFGGNIKRWDDDRLRRDNPGASLPPQPITVVRRADGSGTTRVLTEYFAKVCAPTSAPWRAGTGFRVQWPAGTTGSEHSDGVATAVRDTNNSIGYVEYAYALNNNLNHGFVMNRSGQFVRADSDSISAAIPEQLPPGSRDVAYAILNPAAPDAYPITALTWLLIPLAPKDQARPVLVDFLTWTLQPDAQLQAKLHGYVELPERLRTLGLDSIRGVR